MNTDKIYAEAIANEYAPKDASKVIALKKLDRKAKLPSEIFAYTFGVAGALILGVGMCLCIQVIGTQGTLDMIFGSIIGVIGLLVMGINYPIYKKLRQMGKKKYAYDIMTLAKEISDEKEN